jgi:nitroreductase
MDVITAIESRRAFRSLEHVDITDEIIYDLARCANLAPSCFNNQPERFVFAKSPAVLEQLHTAMSRGNDWTFKASLIVAVFAKQEMDCNIKGREYYLFDVGISVGLLLLRATEMGLVAHPIAGYDEDKAKQILGIPADMKLITLINIGKHTEIINPVLSEKQIADEHNRPNRKLFDQFAFIDTYEER